jgi:hypothetical protein
MFIYQKNTKLLFIVLSLYPTWIVDPDTALITLQGSMFCVSLVSSHVLDVFAVVGMICVDLPGDAI